MGNENSHLSGLEIKEKSVQVTNFWSQHSATIVNGKNVKNITVFMGELCIEGSRWTLHTPLEKNGKNIMIYRHPCIVKYISSWQKNSKFYLATEEVMPLNHVLPKQSSLQICIGLHSILRALCFLHEVAQVSHNNVCVTSIYVTKEGNWKLGGMEYLCKFSDLTSDYLNKLKSNRYIKAIDSNEHKYLSNARKDLIDIFAFGVFIVQVLNSKFDEEVPSLADFRDLAKNKLQNTNVDERPKLSFLLYHDFFSHDFITIYSFLIELPLKSDEEKTKFFTNLIERLRKFQELTIAGQLGGLLLSRMVLLNKTAQTEVLPLILCPKQDATEGFFTEDVFKKFIVPKLLDIFGVRDVQIRLLLLNYFPQFIQTFTKEELQSCILPELLVGVKDTNDNLVSVTLRILADLVPVLGAATVIGGQRGKLFNDGRPITHLNRIQRQSKQQVQESNEVNVILPERPRPDGEEVETSTEEIEPSIEEDLDNWEDWDVEENHNEQSLENAENMSEPLEVVISERMTRDLPDDINELDIKNQVKTELQEDFDFFQDMEPVIETSSKYIIKENISKKLSANVVGDYEEGGWVDEEWD